MAQVTKNILQLVVQKIKSLFDKQQSQIDSIQAAVDNNSPLLVTYDGTSLDKKYSEIYNAYKSNQKVIITNTQETTPITWEVTSEVAYITPVQLLCVATSCSEYLSIEDLYATISCGDSDTAVFTNIHSDTTDEMVSNILLENGQYSFETDEDLNTLMNNPTKIIVKKGSSWSIYDIFLSHMDNSYREGDYYSFFTVTAICKTNNESIRTISVDSSIFGSGDMITLNADNVQYIRIRLQMDIREYKVYITDFNVMGGQIAYSVYPSRSKIITATSTELIVSARASGVTWNFYYYNAEIGKTYLCIPCNLEGYVSMDVNPNPSLDGSYPKALFEDYHYLFTIPIDTILPKAGNGIEITKDTEGTPNTVNVKIPATEEYITADSTGVHTTAALKTALSSAGGGSDSPFFVITKTSFNASITDLDKTTDEIKEAAFSGKILFLNIIDNFDTEIGYRMIGFANHMETEDGDTVISFPIPARIGTTKYLYTIKYNYDGTVSGSLDVDSN